MPKALGFIISIVVFETGILFRAVVPRELKQAFELIGFAVLWDSLLAGIAKEVKVKSSGLVFGSPYKRHSQNFLVKLERLLGVLDTYHGVVLHACQ